MTATFLSAAEQLYKNIYHVFNKSNKCKNNPASFLKQGLLLILQINFNRHTAVFSRLISKIYTQMTGNGIKY